LELFCVARGHLLALGLLIKSLTTQGQDRMSQPVTIIRFANAETSLRQRIKSLAIF
jgi:hypothetical protein